MRFHLLGRLEVETLDGTRWTVPSPRQRALLAALVLDAGTPVSSRRLVDIAWGPQPPAHPRRRLNAHIYRLRRWLRRLHAPYPQSSVLTAPDGYVVGLDGNDRDLDEFAGHVRRARADRSRADARGAVAHYRRALALWRGPALADVRREVADLDRRAAALDELRLTTWEELVPLELACSGADPDLVAELSGLVAANPARESMRGLLMLALYRAGRRADALAAFDAGRIAARNGHNGQPGTSLRHIHEAILRDDPAAVVEAGELSASPLRAAATPARH